MSINTNDLDEKWMVEASNRSGTAHYWYSQPAGDGLCISYCGRQQVREGLQPKDQALRLCSKCSAIFSKNERQR